MTNLQGTRTEENILKAFAGESQARNRYTYFASQAKKDGYVQVQEVFLETADQEKEHAKRLFKFLEGGEVEISDIYPPERLALRGRTCAQPRGVRTTSTQPCTPSSPEPRRKRGSPRSPRYSGP